MEIKVLKKYDRSRLRNSLIRDLSVYSNGKVVVNAENGDKKEFWIDATIGYSDSITDYDADYILCAIQGDSDIDVSKY
jgi:hypothetical protein